MPVGIVAESEWTANSGREGMDSEQWQRGSGQQIVVETADSGGGSRQWWGQIWYHMSSCTSSQRTAVGGTLDISFHQDG